MKPFVPSTRGLLTMALYRNGAGRVNDQRMARFGSIREILNAALRAWDTKNDPVHTVTITFTTDGDRSRHGRETE